MLGDHSLQLERHARPPVRMAESPLLTTAPRAVYQVVLPKDPDKGYIVVYEFPDPAPGRGRRGRAAGATSASGPGRVQTPQGTVTRHPPGRARRSSSTSGCRTRPRIRRRAGIQTALETLGIGFPVAN